MNRTPMKRGKGLRRRGRAYERRKARSWGPDGYVPFIHRFPCCQCHGFAGLKIDASHVESRNRAGEWWKIVPHCRACHRYFEAHKKQADRDYLLRLAEGLRQRFGFEWLLGGESDG